MGLSTGRGTTSTSKILLPSSRPHTLNLLSEILRIAIFSSSVSCVCGCVCVCFQGFWKIIWGVFPRHCWSTPNITCAPPGSLFSLPANLSAPYSSFSQSGRPHPSRGSGKKSWCCLWYFSCSPSDLCSISTPCSQPIKYKCNLKTLATKVKLQPLLPGVIATVS